MLAVDQIQRKVSEWKITAQSLKECTDKCNDSEELRKTAERIVKCGEILDTYAGLIVFASDRYEENEKSLIRNLEE